MKTTTNQQSLLANAFEVLLKNLGPQKTVQLWQVLATPYGDYLAEREKLFAEKDITALYEGAKQFNRDKRRR
jgi:activator of 2-hydroxyglutaryl-CoA dehydratase